MTSKNIIPPIHAQLTKSASAKTIKDYVIPSSLHIKLNKQTYKYRNRINQTPISDKSTCSHNTSSITQKYQYQDNGVCVSRNLNISNHLNHIADSNYDFKSNGNNRIVVKRIYLDRNQSKIDSKNNSNTFCEIRDNGKEQSPKFKKKIISLMKHPNSKYITPISMNNSLQKEHSNSPIGCYKKPIKLNSSMDNMSVNISKINKISIIKTKAVSPICLSRHNISNTNNNNNDISFDNAEGPEDVHFIFVKLFQKKKAFYEHLLSKIEHSTHEVHNDLFSYE